MASSDIHERVSVVHLSPDSPLARQVIAENPFQAWEDIQWLNERANTHQRKRGDKFQQEFGSCVVNGLLKEQKEADYYVQKVLGMGLGGFATYQVLTALGQRLRDEGYGGEYLSNDILWSD